MVMKRKNYITKYLLTAFVILVLVAVMITSKKNKGVNISVSIGEQFRLKEGDSASTENFKVTLDRISILANRKDHIKAKLYFSFLYAGKPYKQALTVEDNPSLEKRYPIGVEPFLGGLSINEYAIEIKRLNLDRKEVTMSISEKNRI